MPQIQPGFFEGVAFTAWLLYVVTKDLGIPIVRAINQRRASPDADKATQQQMIVPADCMYIEPLKTKVIALEIDLSEHRTRVASLSDLFREQQEAAERASIAHDNKLDMVLAELKDLREHFDGRFERVDTRLRPLEEHAASTKAHLEHLLSRRARSQGD